MMTTLTSSPVHYPDSDGNPMADNTKQLHWIMLCKIGLDALYATQADVFIAGDLLWYPVEGQPKIRQAPDVMVVFGRPKADRGSYKQWEEAGVAPQIAFEILSPGNTLLEMARKFEFYEEYGIEEYYIYNPDTYDFSAWQRRDGKLRVAEFTSELTSPRMGIRFMVPDPPAPLEIYHPNGRRFVDGATLSQERDRLAAKLRELGIDPDTV
ncbi:Uma2 family endonuclease [Armatimonas rosea]|uniref:Uma2 family endonuclease n=1 Tax=Armatimonas rosea TaxID=685828 RepID=A0A7W9SS17_ARMRO|nr:Uma2 family endonuclease [Armatimonas rosea]MBB6051792.1 Uma2 family endonuclease [Armatimonas rosea]